MGSKRPQAPPSDGALVHKHLSLLGHKARCRVTGFTGVITSVCFDLYGCIQAAVTPPSKPDLALPDGRWFDVSRLECASKKPVMDRPSFVEGPVAEGKHGPAEKPVPKA